VFRKVVADLNPGGGFLLSAAGVLWPRSNKTFVPALARISIYVWRNVPLALLAGAG
jgi:hypothetical protein